VVVLARPEDRLPPPPWHCQSEIALPLFTNRRMWPSLLTRNLNTHFSRMLTAHFPELPIYRAPGGGVRPMRQPPAPPNPRTRVKPPLPVASTLLASRTVGHIDPKATLPARRPCRWRRVAGQGVGELRPHVPDTPRAPGWIRAARGPYRRVDRRVADACGPTCQASVTPQDPTDAARLSRLAWSCWHVATRARATAVGRPARRRGGGRERCPHVYR
jgi:hypothetical protein